MRSHHQCPKCDGDELWVIDPVQVPKPSDHSTMNVMRVAEQSRTQSSSRGGIQRYDKIQIGTFEAWICDGCGYTEWYAKDFKDLAKLAAHPDAGIRMVRGSASGKGYR